MLLDTLVFLIVFLFILISILGYGFLIGVFLKFKIENFEIGELGLLGIFFATFISYSTHFFFSHGIIHNLFFNIIGFSLFFFYSYKYYNYFKYNFFYLGLIIILFLPGLFISKNHDDFPYYHLPFILNIIEHKLQFGMGHINEAFRTPSSLFYVQSLFFLPYVKYYLIHSISLIILIFINSILISYIFKKNNHNINNFIKIFSIISLTFINIQFWRIAEFGTDRAGQLISLIVFINLFLIFNIKDSEKILQNIKILLILIFYLISIKSYFISYIIILPFILFIMFRRDLIKKILLDLKLILLLGFFLIFFIALNIFNSGCLIYPLTFTCYDNFFWSLSKESIYHFSKWYELWSKSGAGPNFRVDNPDSYLTGLNWINGWFNRYFLVKVTDTLGLIFFICLIYFILLIFKKKFKVKITYLPICFCIFILFLIWFFKHPDLRYGGFILLATVFFVPLSLYLSSYKVNLLKEKAVLIILFLVIISYPLRNIYRINNEIKRTDNFKYTSFPYYHVEKIKYEEKKIKDSNTKFYLTNGWCWATPSPCSNSNILINVVNGYNFFYIKK
jgi:hypothetical protein